MKRIRHLLTLLLASSTLVGWGATALLAQTETTPPAPPAVVAPSSTEEMSPAPTPAPDDREGLRRLDVEATDVSADAAAAGEAAVESSAPAEAPVEAAVPSPHRRRSDNQRVNIFANVLLGADETASEAVAIMGDVVVDGKVDQQSVAVLGDVTVNGSVGSEVVAVLGKATINGEVHGQVVSILGGVQIGPEAHIYGDIVSVGGLVKRAPGSKIDGNVQEIPFLGDHEFSIDWLKEWVRKCLIWGRPLWFGEHLGWAWMMAGAFLLMYALIALISPKGIERCCRTMETKPGLSIVTALLAIFILPLAMIVLSFTVIGAFVLGFLMFFIGIFGKAVFLAWLGRRFTRTPDAMVPVVAVLLGGLVLTAIYLVPFLGFAVQKLSGVLGTGIVLYTILLAMQSDRPKAKAAAAAAGSNPVPQPPAVPSGPAGDVLPMAATTPEPAVTRETNVPPPLNPSAPSGSTGGAFSESGAAASARSGPGPGATRLVQASSLPRAGFWVRLAATLIDLIVLGIVVNVAETRMFSPGDYFPLVSAAYFISLWALKGTTIGGIVLGLKIVRLDDRPVDWSVAVVRGLGAFLSLFVAGFGFIWVAFDSDRQSWHDKIAGTTIVRVPKGTPLI